MANSDLSPSINSCHSKAHQVSVLWDIDGTLVPPSLNSENKHLRAIEEVMAMRPNPLAQSSGMTDLQIIEATLRANQITCTTGEIRRILNELDRLGDVDVRREPLVPLAGVKTVLDYCDSSGWENGLLTGNTPLRARAKLDSAGLWSYFLGGPTFFGHESSSREDLVRKASHVFRQEERAIGIIVGDTPLDILAASRFGFPVVAVASGHFTKKELEAFRPDIAIDGFEQDFGLFQDFMTVVLGS